MNKLIKALELLNNITVSGVDNCTKIAFISQIIRETIDDMEKGEDDDK